MFPSDSNGNNNDPITYIDHSTILHTHFASQFYKQEDFSLSNFHIPSPCYYNNHWSDHLEVLEGFDGNFIHQPHDISSPQQLQQALMADNSVSDTIINMPDSSKNEGSTINCTKESHTNGNANGHQQMLWKSTSKKDRHSKIITKKGPRDRRMRLSLAVAREFFSLQDMLGYDKASKTVEWLLIQAKPEIKKLLGRSSQVSEMFNNIHSSSTVVVAAAKSPSETSEGEVVSAIDIHKAAAMEGKGKASIKGKKIIRKPRKLTFRPVTRDLREQARARAKERTKAKSMWAQRLDGQSKLCNNDPNKVSCYGNCFDIGEAYSGTQDHNSNNSYLQQAMVPEVKEVSFHNHELITRISHGDSNNISNLIFNCLQNNREHHHLTGFLPFGKPWEEGYNNQNM